MRVAGEARHARRRTPESRGSSRTVLATRPTTCQSSRFQHWAQGCRQGRCRCFEIHVGDDHGLGDPPAQRFDHTERIAAVQQNSSNQSAIEHTELVGKVVRVRLEEPHCRAFETMEIPEGVVYSLDMPSEPGLARLEVRSRARYQVPEAVHRRFHRRHRSAPSFNVKGQEAARGTDLENGGPGEIDAPKILVDATAQIPRSRRSDEPLG